MLFAVGDYTVLGGPGVAVIRAEKEEISLVCASRAIAQPTWVMQSSHQPHILYATGGNEVTREGLVASFIFRDGKLTLLSSQPTGGKATCHLALDAEEENLYAANYLDGSVSVFPLDKQGRIGPCRQFFPYAAPVGPNAARQECSHAHQCAFRPGARELFVCNLGTDQVMIFDRLSDGSLALRETIAARPGTGPRHLIFDGPDRFYLAGELDGWVSVYDYADGAWQCRQVLSTLPQGVSPLGNTAAAIRMDDKRVYVSNRGHDSIALFDKGPDGLLTPAGNLPVPGQYPRDFRLWNGGFLLAQQNGGGVAFMDRDGVPGPALPLDGAVCLWPMEE